MSTGLGVWGCKGEWSGAFPLKEPAFRRGRVQNVVL